MSKPFEGDGAERFFSLGEIQPRKLTAEEKRRGDAFQKALGIGKYAKKKTTKKKTVKKK